MSAMPNRGPAPWQQRSWDWRAAGNFVCGGAGAGLLVMVAVVQPTGLQRSALLLVGAALIALGLGLVWHEIGRPWRALNVFINLRASWMSREALVAALLLPLALAVSTGVQAWTSLMALLALAFVYCQARIVQACKGIPAWREPLTVPLIVITALAEGAGLLCLLAPGLAARNAWLGGLLTVLMVARMVVAQSWCVRLNDQVTGAARQAITRSVRWMLVAGGIAPLAVVAVAAAGWLGPWVSHALWAAAGLAVAASGAAFKSALITRAGFNQGFALTHLPVRGARR